MKHYIGVKHIQAEPMEKDGKAGYKVVYPDGYESWSPKEVFEEAYYFCYNEELATKWLKETKVALSKIQELAEFLEFKMSKMSNADSEEV